MSKEKSLPYMVAKELQEQLRIGQSKHRAKADEGTHSPEGIFSWSTYHSYVKQCVLFARWVKEWDPKCRTLADARAYAPAYLERRKGSVSPYTVHLDACALGKLYRCHTEDFGVKLPPRERKNITRSRGTKVHDKHFSEARNQAVVDFCRGTGLRRSELRVLEVGDVADDGSWVYVRKGKGGKARRVPVLPKYRGHVAACVRGKAGLVFRRGEIKNRMDEHALRREYAQAYYELVARGLSTLNRKEKYYCRKDKAGVVYDRAAMLTVSKALGHNRISVIAGHYID